MAGVAPAVTVKVVVLVSVVQKPSWTCPFRRDAAVICAGGSPPHVHTTQKRRKATPSSKSSSGANTVTLTSKVPPVATTDVDTVTPVMAISGGDTGSVIIRFSSRTFTCIDL